MAESARIATRLNIQSIQAMNTQAHPIRLLTQGAQQIAIAVFTRALHTPKYIADVFIYWHPHCGSFTANVSVGGWTKENTEPKQEFNFRVTEDIEYLEREYSRFIALLDKLEAETPSDRAERLKLIAETKAAELRNQAQKLLSEAEQIAPTANPIPAFSVEASE